MLAASLSLSPWACERARAPDRVARDARTIELFLCGDVMTGRGIDQILPHPSEPTIYESFMQSAVDYVRLAERANGPIPRTASFAYPWGDALPELLAADARIVNLETAVTTSNDREPKGINYRMHPKNVACLGAAKLDVCNLANNHALDWGTSGLEQTLHTLHAAGISTAGAGSSLEAARLPAIVGPRKQRRILVYGMGARTSGIASSWAATPQHAGVRLLEHVSARGAADVAADLRRFKRRGDLAVASIHWGPNWGYDVTGGQRDLARFLIDSGFDAVHGHSTHHAIGVEVYRERPILYGCGDFLNDYEGIDDKAEYRGDLMLAYFASFDLATGVLVRLELSPFRVRRFRLERASRDEALWLARVLGREGARFGTSIELRDDGRLMLEWRS